MGFRFRRHAGHAQIILLRAVDMVHRSSALGRLKHPGVRTFAKDAKAGWMAQARRCATCSYVLSLLLHCQSTKPTVSNRRRPGASQSKPEHFAAVSLEMSPEKGASISVPQVTFYSEQSCRFTCMVPTARSKARLNNPYADRPVHWLDFSNGAMGGCIR